MLANDTICRGAPGTGPGRFMQEAEDTDLLLAAGRGDREAFGVLVERHHRSMVQFVYRFLGDRDLATAEDLAQDVFLAAWRGAPSFEPRAKVVTWLLRIARNTLPEPPESPPSPQDRFPRGCRSGGGRLRTIRAARSARHRRRDRRGRPGRRHRTAAQPAGGRHSAAFSRDALIRTSPAVLEISVSAVESALFRARQTLRATLQADGGWRDTASFAAVRC